MGKTQNLMDIRYVEWLNRDCVAFALLEWFYRNGNIAFEHGFKDYIVNKKKKWRITMALNSGVQLIRTDEEGNKETKFAPYSSLPKRTLLRIIRICNKYYHYCLTEA